MTKQTITAAVIGLALSLSLAGSAMADVGDDIREDIELLPNRELADRPEIDCDPRVCGNPPDFVTFDDFINDR